MKRRQPCKEVRRTLWQEWHSFKNSKILPFGGIIFLLFQLHIKCQIMQSGNVGLWQPKDNRQLSTAALHVRSSPQNESDIMCGPSKSKKRRQTNTSAPSETFNFHLTLQCAKRFWETIPRSKISWQLSGTKKTKKLAANSCRPATPNFCMRFILYTSFPKGSEAAVKLQNAIK